MKSADFSVNFDFFPAKLADFSVNLHLKVPRNFAFFPRSIRSPVYIMPNATGHYYMWYNVGLALIPGIQIHVVGSSMHISHSFSDKWCHLNVQNRVACMNKKVLNIGVKARLLGD